MHSKVWLCAAAMAALSGCASSTPRAGYYINPTDMKQVYGAYALSNGDSLHVTREHNRVWAEMGRTGRVEIVPVAYLVFVEKAGALRYTFYTGAFNTEVHIEGSAPPSAYTAMLGGGALK
jgi:hypothetical protein